MAKLSSTMMRPMVFPLGRRKENLRRLAVALVATTASSVCAKQAAPSHSQPEQLRIRIIRAYPHDAKAFTQGLLFLDGSLYESTGLYGRSTLRRVDLTSGQVEQEARLPDSLFGEGLAQVGQRLIQLTWKNHTALVWDLATFHKQAEFGYDGEGWGLCFDGRQLLMSDGSDRLFLRNPTTFAKEGEIHVRLSGRPLMNLNELECVGGVVYANVWQDNHIARIDARTGIVTGWIDASGLLDRQEAPSADVINGIAHMSTTGHLLVTGKLWPHIYEVELQPTGKNEAR
jgi:glutamine cyclotransferase